MHLTKGNIFCIYSSLIYVIINNKGESIRKPNVILIVFLLIVLRCTLLYAKRPDCTVNSDIVITGFETIVMEQGKSKVRPVSRAKNKGSRTYISIQLKFKKPEGLSDKGKVVKLPCNWSFNNSFTLKPGQEDTIIPYKKAHQNLRAETDQTITTYSTDCWFEFADVEGHLYRTPYVTIEKFARVIPANPDIVVTDYQPLTVQQGESKITPVFRVKNKGKRTYRSVRLKYRKPVGILEKGRKREIGIVGYCWSPITLEPGQEVTFNPGCEGTHYIKTQPGQPPLIYSSEYWFEYYDSDGCLYRTPKKEIKDFIRVRPMKEDIVLVDYKTVESEQGKDKVVPVFRAKNTGSRIYTDFEIEYDLPEGFVKGTAGTRLKVHYDTYRRKGLKPGQEVEIKPFPTAQLFRVKLKNPSQKVFSTQYRLHYYDAENCSYKTPKFTIERFVVLRK